MVLKKLRSLEKTQWYSRREIENYQIKKMREIIKYAYDNVPYYHKIMREKGLKPDDFKRREDLKRLPVLTKDIIRARINDLRPKALSEKAILYQTGGSTGEPLKFYITHDMLGWATAATYRAWKWYGYVLGEKQALLWGAQFDIRMRDSMWIRIKDYIGRKRVFNTFYLDSDIVRRIAREINKFKPAMIRGFSSSLYAFSKLAAEEGIEVWTPKVVISTGEKLFDYMRTDIENCFSAKLRDGYGGRETSIVAYQCPDTDLYHISAENGIMEVVRDNESVSEGEIGQILITDFHNKAMPWIRYAVGDAAVVGEECNCGRGLPTLRRIEGRIHAVSYTHLTLPTTERG